MLDPGALCLMLALCNLHSRFGRLENPAPAPTVCQGQALIYFTFVLPCRISMASQHINRLPGARWTVLPNFIAPQLASTTVL